jgi:tetratricopeptide (TPR) repeat protein
MANRLLVLVFVVLAVATAGAQTPTQLPPSRPADASAGQTNARDLVLRKTNPTANPERSVPRGYALVVGIAKYQKLADDKQLQFPESDAESMYRVLISPTGGSFQSENVHFLKGPAATYTNIKRELEEWLPSVAKESDRVVVYFAGHGFVQNGRGYLAPWDVDPEKLDQTAYAMTALGDVMANKVKANWKVLLTDACHSGKINAETTNESLEAQFGALPGSFLTLTATTEREQSFEDPNLSTGFGFFTYFLVQAFNGYADVDPCDGRITAYELIEYVRSNVRRYARERQLSQTPTARGDYEGEMLLGVAKECLGTPDASPSMAGTAVVETNMDDVDLYVDGALIGRLNKSKPLVLPSLPSGMHEFKGVRAGYEPDQKEVMIAPGQEQTVTLRIRYVRQIKKPGQAFNEEGEKLLFTRRSSMSLLNLVPVERKQSEQDLKKAVTLFEKALGEDPNYAIAAYHLGQAQQLLLEYDKAIAAFRKAIAIDPTHVESRTQLAAALIEQGDPDEAIRQLTEASRLDPSNDEIHSMLARAYWDKGAWGRTIEFGGKAIELRRSNAQAYLWKGDAERRLAGEQKDPAVQLRLYADAREDYRTFLDLTNFSTGLGSKLAFHFIGMGVGRRAHADRQGAYDSLRSAGFLGLCITEGRVGNPRRSRDYCKRALDHSPNDPVAHFLIGNANLRLFTSSNSCEYLMAARDSYTKQIKLNPDLDESRLAKEQIGEIETFLPQSGCARP